MTKEQILKNAEYENEILELIDNRDEYTRSDLQALVQALVIRIQRERQVEIDELKEELYQLRQSEF